MAIKLVRSHTRVCKLEPGVYTKFFEIAPDLWVWSDLWVWRSGQESNHQLFLSDLEYVLNVNGGSYSLITNSKNRHIALEFLNALLDGRVRQNANYEWEIV